MKKKQEPQNFKETLGFVNQSVNIFQRHKNDKPSKIKAYRLLKIYFDIALSVVSLNALSSTAEEKAISKKLNKLVPDPIELIVLFIAMGNETVSVEKVAEIYKEANEKFAELQDEEAINQKKASLETNLDEIVQLLNSVKEEAQTV